MKLKDVLPYQGMKILIKYYAYQDLQPRRFTSYDEEANKIFVYDTTRETTGIWVNVNRIDYIVAKQFSPDKFYEETMQ